MAPSLWSKIIPGKEQPTQVRPRLYVDASSFDPDAQSKNGRAVVILVKDMEEYIYNWVKEALRCASGVVVLDRGSGDATPHLAAEAGAVVVLQDSPTQAEAALWRAMQVARQFSDHVDVIER